MKFFLKDNLSSHKTSEKYNERVFYKKAFLKNFAIFTGVSFLMRKQVFSPVTLLKKIPQHVFL